MYHELWKGKLAFIVIYGAYEFQIHYIETEFESEEPVQTTFRENGRKKFMSKSPWIYTNGQVLQEAIEQFQRHCTWSSNGIMPDQRSTPPTKSAIMAMYNKSKFLLSPWKARLLRLEMQQLQELYELDQAGNGRSFVSRIDLYDTGVPCLKFLHATIPAIPQLRRLELDGTMSTNSTEQHDMPSIEVDLRAWKALYVPTSRSVGLTVGFKRRGEGSEEGTVLHLKLREGFMALGIGLVGGVGKEKFTSVGRPDPLGPLWTLEFTRS